MIPSNEGKNKYELLKIKGLGRLLQSTVFNKICLPEQ